MANRFRTVGAKAAVGLPTHLAGRGMEAEGALQEPESFRGHDNEGGKGTTARSLAIAAVTVKHHKRLRCRFVANGAASAAS